MIENKIAKLSDELNKLVALKYIDELTYDDVSIIKNTHTYTKIEYIAAQIFIPKFILHKKNIKYGQDYTRRIKFHIGKKAEWIPLLVHKAYKDEIVNKMKKLALKSIVG
jgi:hypothetical protein